MVTNKQLPEELRRIVEARLDLIERKNSGYAGGTEESNAFKNFDLVEILTSGKVSRETGMFIRMTDKLARLGTLMFGGEDKVGEAVEETLDDLAAYADLTQVAWRDTQKEKDAEAFVEAFMQHREDLNKYEDAAYGREKQHPLDGAEQLELPLSEGMSMDPEPKPVIDDNSPLRRHARPFPPIENHNDIPEETPKSILSRLFNLGRDRDAA